MVGDSVCTTRCDALLERERRLRDLERDVQATRWALASLSRPAHWRGPAQRACAIVVDELVAGLDRAAWDLAHAAAQSRAAALAETARVG